MSWHTAPKEVYIYIQMYSFPCSLISSLRLGALPPSKLSPFRGDLSLSASCFFSPLLSPSFSATPISPLKLHPQFYLCGGGGCQMRTKPRIGVSFTFVKKCLRLGNSKLRENNFLQYKYLCCAPSSSNSDVDRYVTIRKSLDYILSVRREPKSRLSLCKLASSRCDVPSQIFYGPNVRRYEGV